MPDIAPPPYNGCNPSAAAIYLRSMSELLEIPTIQERISTLPTLADSHVFQELHRAWVGDL